MNGVKSIDVKLDLLHKNQIVKTRRPALASKVSVQLFPEIACVQNHNAWKLEGVLSQAR